MRSSPESRQAQVGALELQMLAVGRIDDGLSSVPTRTTVKPWRPVEFAKSWLPQVRQKRRRTSLPLSALRVYSASVPWTSTLSVGNIALAVPLPARCWQSLHQHMRDATGSALI